MGKLIEFAFDDSKPAAVQLETIKDSLNRAGLRPPSEVVLSQGRLYEDVFDSIASGSRAESRARRGYPDAPVEPVDFDTADAVPALVESEEPLGAPESQGLPGGHVKYRTRHIVGDEAFEHSAALDRELRFREIER